MYVKTTTGHFGVLHKTDSTNEEGKYAVFLKGEIKLSYFHDKPERITQKEYDKGQNKPAKQPAKRGSKKS